MMLAIVVAMAIGVALGGGGMSGVPKLTALCIKADIGGVVQFH